MRSNGKGRRSALAAGGFSLLLLAAWSLAGLAGDTPETLLERYTEQAMVADAAFDGFSAERGRRSSLAGRPIATPPGASATRAGRSRGEGPAERRFFAGRQGCTIAVQAPPGLF
jgi:hypothetical protein